MTACLQVELVANAGCFDAHVVNTCGVTVTCNLCATSGGVLLPNSCGVGDFAPGQHQDQWNGWWWCLGDGLRYACALPSDPDPCHFVH
jgi:hypothetical protein